MSSVIAHGWQSSLSAALLAFAQRLRTGARGLLTRRQRPALLVARDDAAPVLHASVVASIRSQRLVLDDYGITVQPGLAIAMCSAPMVLACYDVPPPRDAIGMRVVIAARGKAIGCALLTGVVDLSGERSDDEHPDADRIRGSMSAAATLGPLLWVFEHGVLFADAIEVQRGTVGTTWTVPESLRVTMRTAVRTATGRVE